MSMPFDEIDLIKNAIARSERAWTQLYEKHRVEMLQEAMVYANSLEEAEELMNDAFFYCYRDIDQFRYNMKGGFKGWMKKVVKNTSLNHVKKKKKKKKLLYVALTEYVDVGIPASQISMITTEELKEHIDRLLTPRCREVFYRSVLDNSTHKEIAEIMGIEEETSRSHLRDAKKILKEKLSPLYNIDHRVETGNKMQKVCSTKTRPNLSREYDAEVR